MKDDKYKDRLDGEFSELDYGTRHGFWYAAKWVGACLVAGLVVVGILWAAGVLFAGPRGAGDAYKTNQSGTNRIAKQEMFEDLYQEVKVADQRIDTFAVEYHATPTNVEARTRYLGAITYCQQAVGAYDAEARKYTAEQWRDNELPAAIDRTDPKFDCKEENK